MKNFNSIKTIGLFASLGFFANCSNALEAENLNAPALGLFDRIANLSQTSPLIVDNLKGMSQLQTERRQSKIDSCLRPESSLNNFQDAIEIAIRKSIVPMNILTSDYVDRLYGIKSGKVKMGLISHPLCVQKRSQVKHILGEGRLPDDKTIERLMEFAADSNKDRLAALDGDDGALQRFTSRWTVFMGCLAYAESLQTSDEKIAKDAFGDLIENKKDLSGYYGATDSKSAQKPSGVHFGVDRDGDYFIELRRLRRNGGASSAALKALNKKYSSWAVMGLYQFKPDPRGNINSCIDQWNDLVSGNECKIDDKSNTQVFLAFGSYGQSVNAFCGVQKIVQAFSTQANTSNKSGTDLTNVNSSGSLKSPNDRCVGLVARSGKGKIYSHFGPLGNSVGDNLKGLMECVTKATWAIK